MRGYGKLSSWQSATDRLLKRVVPFAAALVVLLGVTPVRADDTTAVPFSAYFDGRAAVNTATSSPYRLEGAGYGTTSYLYDSWLSFVQTTDSSKPVQEGLFLIAAGFRGALYGEYRVKLSTPDAAGVAQISGTYTVTQGMGLYFDAVGSGTLVGTLNVATGLLVLIFDGVITPPPGYFD